MNDVHLCDCGHLPSPHEAFTNGYATDAAGKTLCYECCAEVDKEHMRKHGKIDLYLTVKDSAGKICRSYPTSDAELSNWPNSLKFNLLHVGRSAHYCFGGWQQRFDVSFVFEGYVWHGVQRGNMNQICRCKRTKTEWRLVNSDKPELGYTSYAPRKSRAKEKKV